MEIIKLKPAFKDYLWGGTKLKDIYNKDCDFQKVAESWELSAHSAGQSIVGNGQDAGLPLTEYLKKHPGAAGKNGAEFEEFPVLIKLIDAKQPLSVQVHPSDEYALRVEKEYGKTEMWYIVDSEPGAKLYFGVNRTLTKEEFQQRIEENTLTEILNEVPVKPGDVFFIESGTLHAIGGGILICEIQQNSNTTYRVYDYGRRDDDGNLRELHIEKAVAVSNLTPSDTADKQQTEEKIEGGSRKLLAACKYFTCEKYAAADKVTLSADGASFVSLMMLIGKGKVVGEKNEVEFKPGDSMFIPAGAGEFVVEGECTFIKTTV
jgi:Phosphomannose isomerase